MAEDSALPPPPVPPECDLRGYPWMQWFGQQLADSDFAAHATDSEFRAGVTLWWACWTQVPAASLPDDDAVLARLAGFGRDVSGWRKVRTRALHGFSKHSDARLYHRFLAPLALESWKRRVGERARKAKNRAGKAPGTDADGDADTTRTDASDPRPVLRERKGEHTTGNEKTLVEAPIIPRADLPEPAPPTCKADTFDHLPDDKGWGPDQEEVARDWAQSLAERGEDTPRRLRKGMENLTQLHAEGNDIGEVVNRSIMIDARGISGQRGRR